MVEVARFSQLPPGARELGGWERFPVLASNPPTAYRAVRIGGETVLEADAEEGGSGLWRKIRIDPRRHPIIEWRWRVPPEAAGAASAESPPVRLSLGFDGDEERLDFDDRTKLRLAKMLTVHGLPYASLLYVWKSNAAPDTVYSSPHTERVRHIVVESGNGTVDRWMVERRNVLEDYRRAFGEEPGDIVAVGIMTDVGDDGSRRRVYYGDISFRTLPATAHEQR